MLGRFYNCRFADLSSLTIRLTVFDRLFIARGLRTSHTLLFYFLFTLRKSWIFSNFHFKGDGASLLVLVGAGEVLGADDNLLLGLGHHLFSALFHLAGFRIKLVDDFCFHLAGSQFAGFDSSLILRIVVDVFDFDFHILGVIIFRRFHLGSDFDNMLLRFYLVGFRLGHFAVSFAVFNGLLILYIVGAYDASLNFLTRSRRKLIVISDFHFKGNFEVFFVFHFAGKVRGAHFDNGVHRFFFRYLRIFLNFRVYNRPFGFSGAEFALLFHAVHGLVSPIAFFKLRIDFDMRFKGQFFRMGVGSVGHGTHSDNLFFGFLRNFFNGIIAAYHFAIDDMPLGRRGFQTVFSGLRNFFFAGF